MENCAAHHIQCVYDAEYTDSIPVSGEMKFFHILAAGGGYADTNFSHWFLLPLRAGLSRDGHGNISAGS